MSNTEGADMPKLLENLDNVSVSAQAGEGWCDAGWRVAFNRMANYNWLGFVRKTKLYHDTKEVIDSLDVKSRKIFPGMFIFLNVVYWGYYWGYSRA